MKRDDLLDLNDVLQHPGRKLAVEIETDLDKELPFELSRSVTGYLEAVSTGNLLLLTGEFIAGVISGCARCGEPIEVDVSFELDEQFPVDGVPSSYSHTDFARVKPEEPYPLFEGNSLQVDTLLRQDLIVAAPIQPLCQYGWDGDCPIAKARGKIKIAENPDHPLAGLQSFRNPEEVNGEVSE